MLISEAIITAKASHLSLVERQLSADHISYLAFNDDEIPDIAFGMRMWDKFFVARLFERNAVALFDDLTTGEWYPSLFPINLFREIQGAVNGFAYINNLDAVGQAKTVVQLYNSKTILVF